VGHQSLTGRWIGRYDYDGGGPVVSFEARLVERGGALWGETVEPNTFRPDLGAELAAVLMGEREGAEVRFVKTYTGFNEGDRPRYSGHANAALTRIAGIWRIRLMTGRFVMVRDEPASRAKAKQRAKARAT
jgi:hypothetical protein